jgi:cell division protease FtsH
MKEEIFNDIIGYEEIKNTLKRILDIINNKEKYKKLGSTIPHGLLLNGSPGVGKSCISKDFIKHSNRKSYIIRKTKSDGDFINYINKIFEQAKKNQPSIILLDDLDKFSENDEKGNKEEYVAVQSLIDDIKDNDIFVIATTNDIDLLPDSLKRSGRFDIKLYVEKPKEKDLANIIEHYLKKKKLAKDVNIKNISYILSGASCADLEKICNQAGIYAGYKNNERITMEDLIISSLEWAYDTNIEDLNKDDKYSINIAYHEAGHALIGELLQPGSVSFITTLKTNSDKKGLTKLHYNDDYFYDITFMENRIKTLLGGKAATELIFKKCDVGCNSDLHRVYDIARRFPDDYCESGFDSWINNRYETSEKVKQNKDDKTNKLITDFYNEVKELLLLNKPLLDKLAHILKEKKILFQDEIQEILTTK